MISHSSTRDTGWLIAGLFFATLATLLLEILDARLLSVLTWYHLSFFAVSLAMLGMAAGAVFVFVNPEPFSPERAPQTLAATTFLFACAIPVSHLMTLTIPFLPLTHVSVMEVLSVAVSTVVLAAPFALSGVAVTCALTRCGGPIGRLYAFDLVGAAAGCAVVVPLLEKTNVSSAILLAGAAAAVAAVCFARFARQRNVAGRPLRAAVLAAALVTAALFNTGSHEALAVIYPKNRQLWNTNSLNAITRWNSHSYVLVQQPGEEASFMWGPGKGAEQFKSRIAWMAIDGEAGTPITQWNGDVGALDWVSYDVTALPYSVRNGDVAVIGVGGGRDILSALWGRNRSVLGVDVNQIMIDLQRGSHLDFAHIADRPEVTLVHDDGRAYLTRTSQRFDIIQMSLVDTWAATGAGAFTLSENGLYTVDAWRVFLNRLKPGGVLSVSRWFDPTNASESSRLVALGVGALLDRGVTRPLDQLVLIVRGRVATLMVSNAPFTSDDQQRVEALAAAREFNVAVAPWRTASDGGLLDRISRSTSPAALAAATADTLYDYTPPTDSRPYYFNMLKPRAVFEMDRLPRGGALGGNLRATLMLVTLLGVSVVLVLLIIVWPLIRSGRPPMPFGRLTMTMSYFATIGFAYMLIQIGLLQRFAIYVGHPTYTLAIVLFSMLLFTGLGSFLSERLRTPGVLDHPGHPVFFVPLDRRGHTVVFVPVTIALALALVAWLVPVAIDRTITSGLVVRTLVVLAFTAPLSMLLGVCFPIGVRLVEQTRAIVAWAWGVNGAFGVLASIVGVATSMWIGVDANFWIAAALYLVMTAPLVVMIRNQTS